MMPGLWVTQVNCRPGSNSVTMKSAGLSFGCRTCARAPIASGPGSSRVTLVMLVVHSCHRSTSLITAHTADGGACTSTLMLKSFTGTLHVLRARSSVQLSKPLRAIRRQQSSEELLIHFG